MNLTRKQIEALLKIHGEAYRGSPMMALDLNHGSDVISTFAGVRVSAKENRGYPDGEYEAEWLIDDHGGVTRVR